MLFTPPKHSICNMKRKFLCTLVATLPLLASAQSDSIPFKGHFENEEYGVFLEINLYEQNINVPAHELFGPLPGYFGKRRNGFYWLVTDGKPKTKAKAELSLINDYGSEDLKATLTKRNDSTFVLRQEEGSVLKVPNNGKWLKLPKELELKKKLR